MDYLLISVATMLIAFEFAFSKGYQTRQGVSIKAGLRFNALCGLFSALTMWVISGFRLEWSGFSFLMALGMSLFCTSYSLLSFQILKTGGMALYSMFLMSGGMLLPYVFGIVFLEETLTVFRILGVLAVLAGVILSNLSKEAVSKKLLFLCCGVFFLNGFVSIFSKCHQVATGYFTVDSATYAMYSGLGRFLFSAVALLFCKQASAPPMQKSALGMILGAAAIGGISYLLQLIGARTLPATALYPMVTGGAIIFSALAGRVFFKEKLSRQQLWGIGLSFIGTLLFL